MKLEKTIELKAPRANVCGARGPAELSFAWRATSRGVTTLASHRVAETAADQST